MVATFFTFAVLLQEAGAPSFDLRDMLKNMGTLALVVVFILFVLSIYSFGVMIDRFLMYSAARKQSRVFVQQVAGALKDGTIQSLEVMSGHPLLQQAALDAVRQWRYQPTLLNGEPVDVDTTIDVIFSLNQ